MIIDEQDKLNEQDEQRNCPRSHLRAEAIDRARHQAKAFKKKLVASAHQRVPANAEGQGLFFLTLFQMAGASIESDVDSFCDRAEGIFETLEAYGQDPTLDEDWLAEITGQNDTFYFSTENLVSDLISPPRSLRQERSPSEEERERFREEIEAAILDEEPGQNFQQTLAVAHSENVQDWIKRIGTALANSSSKTLEFWSLQRKTRLKPVELFLGLLLGQENWYITQTGGFFSNVQIALQCEEDSAKRTAQRDK